MIKRVRSAKYVYDAWNRLVEVKDGETSVQTNEYDGLGRRIVRVDVAASDTYDYFYNESWQVVNGLKDGAVEFVFHWHPYYIDALAVRWYDEDTDGELAENDDGAYYAIQDANYNVTAITDDGGAVKERYQYSPYGEVTFLEDDFDVKGSQITNYGNTHLYTGRERDAETGLQLNRNRFYAAHLGRWVNRDPIGYADGYNLYEYTSSAPSGLVDPTGTSRRIECEMQRRTCYADCVQRPTQPNTNRCLEDCNSVTFQPSEVARRKLLWHMDL